jgi:hypothetical protein
MKWLTDNRAVGLVLIVASLAADVVLTLTGHTIPATIASIATAGIGLLTTSIVRRPNGG